MFDLSVNELFRLGEKNSLRIKEAQIREVIASEKEKDAQTSQYPNINVGATGGYIGGVTVFKKGLSHPTHPDLPDWSQNYNLELTQSLYTGGKIRSGIKQVSLEKQIASLNLADDKAELKILLLRQYLDLICFQKQEEVFIRNIEEANRRLKDIRRMRKEGLVTRNDEIRSELQLTNDSLNYQEAKNHILIVSQQLDVVLGLDENLVLRPDTTALWAVSILSGYEDYVQKAYQSYPGLQIAHYHTKIAGYGVKYSKAASLPSLSLRMGNTLARPLTTSMQDVFMNNWNVMLNLSYNLSSLYQNKHKIQEARQDVFLRQIMEEQLKQEIRTGVKSAYLNHAQAVKRVHALLLSVQQAEENYRIVHNRYMNQLSPLTDLMDAISVRSNAELQLTVARTEILYTYYELRRSCGDL